MASITASSKRIDAYTKVVLREIGKAEAILKLVQTPSYRLVESLPVIWPAATESDLVDLMNLKGIKKSDQDQFIEQYKSSPDYKPDEASTGGDVKSGSTAKTDKQGKKKKDFWSFVTDTKKNMETHVDKAKKAALSSNEQVDVINQLKVKYEKYASTLHIKLFTPLKIFITANFSVMRVLTPSNCNCRCTSFRIDKKKVVQKTAFFFCRFAFI